MRVTRSASGLRLDVDGGEAVLLRQLFEQLVGLLGGQPSGRVVGGLGSDTLAPGTMDAVIGRLFPVAYPDDPAAQQGFAAITAETQRSDRVERATACLSELAAASGRRRLRLELDHEAAQRWLQTLNDLRLALGTALDVREENDWDLEDLSGRAGKDPVSQWRLRYVWLTAVQDGMVRELMGE